MQQLAKTIQSVFADFDEGSMREAMKLSEIPDWDSMNAVNLLVALESAYHVELMGTLLSGSMTIGELAGLLKQRGAAL